MARQPRRGLRIPARLMPHQIKFRRPAKTTPTGQSFGAWETCRAYVEKRVKVFGYGTSSARTSTAQVWVDPEHDIPAMTEVVIFEGTPREETLTVIELDVREAPRAPSHELLYLGKV